MRRMTREERFKFLSIFGDGQPHDWFNVVFLGVQYLDVHQKTFEQFFRQALEDQLIQKVETEKVRIEKRFAENKNEGLAYIIGWEEYSYKIDAKGDTCLRREQISREGDYSYYKDFDRSLTGSHGLDHFAPLPDYLKKEKGNERKRPQ